MRLSTLASAQLALVGLQDPAATPEISLQIQPVGTKSVDYWNATLSITGAAWPPGATMLQMSRQIGPTPNADYTQAGNPIIIQDDRGDIPYMMFEDDRSTQRTWTPNRDTVGTVMIRLHANPRVFHEQDQIGPRTDMRVNSNGIISSGMYFVPYVRLPDRDNTESDPSVRLAVTWDTLNAPAGTKNHWSFQSPRTGPAAELVESIYASSPSMKSWRAPEYPAFSLSWLETPPSHLVPNVSAVAESIGRMFKEYGTYFQDPGESYSVWMRRTPRGYGGTAFRWSFVLEWDAGVRLALERSKRRDDHGQASAAELISLLSHEIVHNWPSMQSPIPGVEDPNTEWFEEGIATYLGQTLPHRYGLIGADDLVRNLNIMFSAYYTSPAIHLSAEEAAATAWQNTHAQRLPYYRGALFLMHLDAAIQTRTEGMYSLQEPINDLLRRRRAGQSYKYPEWRSILARYLDENWTDALYSKMTAGGWVTSPPDIGFMFPHHGVSVDPVEQPMYDQGYTLTRKERGTVVTQIDIDSNAARAGLRLGDLVSSVKYSVISALDDPDEVDLLSVLRNGTIQEIEYSPRSRSEMRRSWKIRIL